MTQWEYKIITEPANLGLAALQGHFTELGNEGWELAGILGLTFIFKREKRMISQ